MNGKTPTDISGKNILRMVKHRFKAAGLPPILTCHTFRATTITDLLEQGVNPDDVQHPASHSDLRTTRLLPPPSTASSRSMPATSA